MTIFPKSLSARIFVIYAVMMVLCVASGLALFYRAQFAQQIEQAQDSAQMLGEVASQSVEESAVIGDYDTIKRTLAKMVSGTTFAKGEYIDVGGALIQVAGTQSASGQAPEWLRRLIAERLYDVNRVIAVGGKDYGVMRLSFDVDSIAYAVWQLIESSAALAIGFLVAGLMVLRALIRRWLGNLHYLQTFQQQVLSGEVTAQALLRSDAPLEIKEAIEAVNRSAESLRDQFGKRIEVLIDSLVQHKNAMDEAAIVCETDAGGVLTYVNDQFVRHSGLDRAGLLGKRLDDIAPSNARSALETTPWTPHKGVWRGEITTRHFNETVQWRRRTVVPIFSAGNEVEKYICIDIDITDRKKSEQAMLTHATRQSLIAEFGRHALQCHDVEALWTKATEVAAQGLSSHLQSVLRTEGDGTPVNAWIYRRGSAGTILSVLADGEDAACLRDLGRLASRGPTAAGDLRNDVAFLSSSLVHTHDMRSALTVPVASFQTIYGYLGLYWDVPRQIESDEIDFLQSIAHTLATASDRHAANVKLSYLAQFDALTDLPNRGQLMRKMHEALQAAQARGEEVAVMFIDLDRFKLVNDTLGHGAGDLLLVQAGIRLRECVRATDVVARLGGDEFAVVLTNPVDRHRAQSVAERTVKLLSEPFHLAGQQVFVSASIGVAVHPGDAVEAGHLLQCADAAMYSAKKSGRNSYRFYTAEMNERVQERLVVEGRLHQALSRHEFVLHYQPKVDLATGEVSGFEALLRWNCPQQGLVSPVDFIPMLEDTGLIVPVGDWVIREVCAQLRRWEKQGMAPKPVAVNLSARQFEQADLAARVSEIVEEAGIAPGLLEFELTESMLMTDPEAASATLARMKAIGLRLSIDDFGTGYSSLAYLKRFPLDCLKIDRAFIRDLASDAEDAAITKAIISLAHSLDLKVVAEGVEDKEQLDLLRTNHCDEMQGFLFSRPLLPAACEDFLAKAQIVLGLPPVPVPIPQVY